MTQIFSAPTISEICVISGPPSQPFFHNYQSEIKNLSADYADDADCPRAKNQRNLRNQRTTISTMLFQYPSKSIVSQTLTKEKIYSLAKPTAAVKKLLVAEVKKITWQHKLSEATVNLPKRSSAPEIQVFQIQLKQASVSESVLKCIDAAIDFPIVFELYHLDKVQSQIAYKRPSEADSSKWVLECYFQSDWMERSTNRESLPVALDLAALYGALLRSHIALPARDGETIREQVDRVVKLRQLERDATKLGARLDREKQYNREVELNREFREMKKSIEQLKR